MKTAPRLQGFDYPEPPKPAQPDIRSPRAFRVGKTPNGGAVALVFDPSLPTAIAFALDRESAARLGRDLIDASGLPEPTVIDVKPVAF